jgi:O-glycosyl hydrolase
LLKQAHTMNNNRLGIRGALVSAAVLVLWTGCVAAQEDPDLAEEANAVTNGRIIVAPNARHHKINGWGYDIKEGSKAAQLDETLAREIFVDDKMSILRVPIYARIGHPSAGSVDASVYADEIAAIRTTLGVKPSVKIFASLKLDGKATFADWVRNSDGTVRASEYAHLLYDYLHFMKSRDIAIDVLGIDNEGEFAGGDITPEKFGRIVNELANRYGATLPRLIAPETYRASDGQAWLDGLFQRGLGNTIALAGVHYYSEQRDAAYVASLEAFARASRSKTKWDSEFHWSAKASNAQSLISAFDHFDNGFQGMTWWSFEPASKGGTVSEMETALVKSTTHAYPIDVNDEDGVTLAAGRFNTRAFRQGRDVVLWVSNDTAKDHVGKWVQIEGKTLREDPTFTQWVGDAKSEGSAPLVDSDSFRMHFPPRSISVVRARNVYGVALSAEDDDFSIEVDVDEPLFMGPE